MYEFEDYSEELLRRKVKLKDGVLSKCVNADTLVDDGWKKVFIELNIESCFERDWRGLAAKLLKPSPTNATIQSLLKNTNPALEMIKTWLAQSQGPKASFELLIATMIKCEVYSACDELLDHLENCERDSNLDLEQREDLNAIVSCDIAGTIEENLQISESQRTPSHINEQQRSNLDLEQREDLNAIVSCDIAGTIEENLQISESQRTPSHINEQQRRIRSEAYGRSHSLPERGGRLRKLRRALRRLLSAPAGGNVSPRQDEPPIAPRPSIPPPPQEDEIFVVSSNPDNETQGMKDLMSFVHKLEPVAKHKLTVKTIHDAEQRGAMSPTWLQERVNRARYVILCFSSKVKAIADHPTDMQQFEDQTDYNLKFTLDFLVTGVLYMNGCRNPKGKFIPVLLPGNDLSTLIVPLRYFLHFSWPTEEKKISNYILNRPDHPVPHQGTPRRLVRREHPS